MAPASAGVAACDGADAVLVNLSSLVHCRRWSRPHPKLNVLCRFYPSMMQSI
jgi:hypothetical protein